MVPAVGRKPCTGAGGGLRTSYKHMKGGGRDTAKLLSVLLDCDKRHSGKAGHGRLRLRDTSSSCWETQN